MKKDLEIVLSDQVKEKMAADPKLAALMKEMFANFRQAQDSVDRGQHKTWQEAMEAITGSRPVRVDD